MISNVEQRTDISGTAQSSFHVWSRHQLVTSTTLFEKKKVTKAWFTQSWCFLIKSTIANCCSCCRCRGGQYNNNNNNNNCYWPLILIKLPFLQKENGKRRTFSRVSKLQNGSHQLFYISFSLRSKRFRLVSGAERDFRFFFVLCSEIAPKRLLRRLHFLFSPVILARARVLLWRLAIALEQMLPAGEVYFRPVMSSKPPSKPRVELIFYSGLQFVGFSSSSFTKSAEFVSLPGKASLGSISGAVLFLWA